MTTDLVVQPPVYADVVVGAPATTDVAIAPTVALDIVGGLPGPQGPTGPPGLIRVDHGTNTNVARPEAPVVLWVGSVEPVNADQAVDLIAWTNI